jgi:hypothetical protein
MTRPHEAPLSVGRTIATAQGLVTSPGLAIDRTRSHNDGTPVEPVDCSHTVISQQDCKEYYSEHT